MSTKQTTYSDTWYDAPKSEDITKGKTVREGATVEANYDAATEHMYVPCTYTDFQGNVWFKSVLREGLK